MIKHTKSDILNKMLECISFLEYSTDFNFSIKSKDKKLLIQEYGHPKIKILFYKERKNKNKFSSHYEEINFEEWFEQLSEDQKMEIIINLNLFKNI